MAKKRRSAFEVARGRRLGEATGILRALGFGPKQRNDVAAYTLLALLDLTLTKPWLEAINPLRGITPIIQFIHDAYRIHYAPNTRETIRDEAVKYFVDAGLLSRNPDNHARPTNSGRTVYQVELHALDLFRAFGSQDWHAALQGYIASRSAIRRELERNRELVRIPVTLPSGNVVMLSAGGQNPLIKTVIEELCGRFVPGGVVVYIGDAEDKFLHLETGYLRDLGVVVPASAKMPDVVIHDARRNWLLLVEAVATAGPVDGKRRRELKALFGGCRAGLVFVTAFANREVMRSFLTQISWETEVWVASDPDHMIHFNGERFLGPYPDVTAES